MTASSRHREKLLFKDNIPVIAYTRMNVPNTSYQPYYHSEVEFHLICQGNYQYTINNVSYNLQDNSLAVIHANEVHSYQRIQPPRCKKMSLIFSPKMIEDKPTSVEIMKRLKPTHHLKLSEKQAGMVGLSIMEIAEECRLKHPHWKSVVVDALEKFLVIVDRARLNVGEKHAVGDPLIKDILAYLDNTFTENISLSDIANHFGLSPYSLSRMFKQYVGLGFQKYLIRLRITEAKRLLEQTDLKVMAVADTVGFGDLSAFNRAFKLLTEVTPSLYRKISL